MTWLNIYVLRGQIFVYAFLLQNICCNIIEYTVNIILQKYPKKKVMLMIHSTPSLIVYVHGTQKALNISVVYSDMIEATRVH